MELPNIDLPGMRYDADGPMVFTCHDLETAVYRPRLCFAFPRKEAGAVVMAAEEGNWREKNRKIFILYLKQFTDSAALLECVYELQREYEIKRIYARLTPHERDFFYMWNENRHLSRRLSVISPPKSPDSGDLRFHIGLLRELLKPGSERVFARSDSELPSLLSAIPKMPDVVSDLEYPALSSVCQIVCAMWFYPTKEPEELHRKKRFNIDDWDPFAEDDPVMSAPIKWE